MRRSIGGGQTVFRRSAGGEFTARAGGPNQFPHLLQLRELKGGELFGCAADRLVAQLLHPLTGRGRTQRCRDLGGHARNDRGCVRAGANRPSQLLKA